MKCWYCNGGLQNWERDDDAWTEYAKWFPISVRIIKISKKHFIDLIVFLECEFVFQQKGTRVAYTDSRTITSTQGHCPGVDFTLQATKVASSVSGKLLITSDYALRTTQLFTHDSIT